MNAIDVQSRLYPNPDKATRRMEASKLNDRYRMALLVVSAEQPMATRTNLNPIPNAASLRGPHRAVYVAQQHQVPIFVIGVPAIKRPARALERNRQQPRANDDVHWLLV